MDIVMENLPVELKREIIKYIPRNDTAQIIYDSSHNLCLTYIRRFQFEDNPLYEERIWNELKPSHLKSLFYGDTKKITRNLISKGQYIHLRKIGVI